MKLKLLFGALVFNAISANAQLATLNENFNNFTDGNATFPQNGWSASVATPSQFPPAPTPMMIITAGADKTVQSYAGNNGTAPSYLITPQIVAPAGDKALTFSSGLVDSSPGTSTIQIGLVSNPTDMGTFTAIGSPIVVSSTAVQNYTVNISASTSSYIVFRITPTAAHTATMIDNVVYDTPPLGTINENFNAFTGAGVPTSLPQNGWNKVINTVAHNVYVNANNGSNTIQLYAGGVVGANTYAISPKIVAPDGSKKIRFTTGISSGSNGSATIEVGMVSNPTDMTTFTSLGAPTNITLGSTQQILTFDVPTSTKQYIAWKFVGAVNHSAIYIDDVIYDVLGALATSDLTKSNNDIKFAVNSENTALQFVGKESPKSVEIYSALGARVAAGTVDYNRFNISTLQTGVYYILIETKDGKTQKSKFIKK